MRDRCEKILIGWHSAIGHYDAATEVLNFGL